MPLAVSVEAMRVKWDQLGAQAPEEQEVEPRNQQEEQRESIQAPPPAQQAP